MSVMIFMPKGLLRGIEDMIIWSWHATKKALVKYKGEEQS
jgi:hypothetical protein